MSFADLPDPAAGGGEGPGGAVVAVDVGGTSLKGAVLDGASRSVLTRRLATGVEQGPDAVVERVLSFTAELAGEAGDRTGTPPRAAGIVTPGIIDERAGLVRYSANLGWRDVPLAGLAERRLGLPVALGHDVRAAGLAEGRSGTARGVRDYAFLALGTGISVAVVLDGAPYAGSRGGGGELGHVVVRPDGPPCGCGRRGCLEVVSSAAAIARRYAERAGSGAVGVTAQHVLDRARRGDPVATTVFTEAVECLADAVVAYAMLLDPELVVVGGGLAEAGEELLAPLRAAAGRRCTFQSPPRFAKAELGEAAGNLGAALLAWQAAGVELHELATR